ncbi:MAG: Xaa-Pro peptidase family protein [Spirochaetaceae bacterium]|jgi:Xaa-Pro dipeptidase|nr:Xaa-Pro peptidase family protein [Spirochaetaceae bacterium]
MGFLERREKVYTWQRSEGINLVMFEDCEHRRDQAVRYLCGHPFDALLFLSDAGKSLLVPWDVNMANRYAKVDAVLPYNEFRQTPVAATAEAAEILDIPHGGKIEIPPVTSHPDFLNYVGVNSDYTIVCRKDGAASFIEKLRSIKDKDEIQIYRTVSDITNKIIDSLENKVLSGEIKTEVQAALFIESEGRNYDCEGTGFTTLAAGSSRSFGIHAFPYYTAGAFADNGLSILDFGLVYQGYTSDVTMTFARGALSPKQKNYLSLIKEAADIAVSNIKTGILARDIALSVDSFFKKHGVSMPHGLGHGIGLQAHEAPFIRDRENCETELEAGMIFTIEPGLYDTQEGGCRYENDILLTESGAEILTKSKIVVL